MKSKTQLSFLDFLVFFPMDFLLDSACSILHVKHCICTEIEFGLACCLSVTTFTFPPGGSIALKERQCHLHWYYAPHSRGTNSFDGKNLARKCKVKVKKRLFKIRD